MDIEPKKTCCLCDVPPGKVVEFPRSGEGELYEVLSFDNDKIKSWIAPESEEEEEEEWQTEWRKHPPKLNCRIDYQFVCQLDTGQLFLFPLDLEALVVPHILKRR